MSFFKETLKELRKPAFQTTFIYNPKCYVGDNVPNHVIKKSFGLIYQVTKGITYNVNDNLESIVTDFVKRSDDMGANAIINFRFETGTYEQNGSQWVSSFIILYGQAVLLEKKETF